MNRIERAMDNVYPKVAPLTQALIAAAAEQGATAYEFDMAVGRIKERLERRAEQVLISELMSEE